VEAEDVVTTAVREAWGQLSGQLGLGTIVASDGETTVERLLELRNPFDQPLTVELSFGDATGWSVTPARAEITIPPRELARVPVNVAVDPALAEGGLAYSVLFRLAERGELRHESVLRARVSVGSVRMAAARVDGSLQEWTGGPTIRIDRDAQLVMRPELWGGPEACSAVAWLGCDDENLYVATRVRDPSLDPWAEGEHAATGDSLEIYLDGRPEGELGRGAYAEGVTYLVVHPGLEGEAARIAYQEARFTDLPGVEVASRLIADGYEMEVAIPLSSFPDCGGVIGFDLAVNDNSDPGGRVQLMWAGTVDNWEDASGFGLVRVTD